MINTSIVAQKIAGVHIFLGDGRRVCGSRMDLGSTPAITDVGGTTTGTTLKVCSVFSLFTNVALD